MNRTLIDNWNDTVDHGDTIYVVGDFAMGKISETLDYAKQLRGTKILVPGNHDRCWRGNKDYEKWIERYESVGFTVWDVYPALDQCGMIGEVFGKDYPDVCISHFPFQGDSRSDDRYEDWRPNDVGQWLIHGHVHDSWVVNGRQINVGADVWDLRPVAAETIKEIIDENSVCR